MSRLDLLKKGTASNNKNKPSSNNPRGGMLEEKTKKIPQREDDLTDDILSDDDFENELEDSPATQYDTDYDTSEDPDENDDENVNIIEIDLDSSNGGLDLDPSLVEDEDEDSIKSEEDVNVTKADTTVEEDNHEDENSDIVEGHLSVDYAEEDIKLEVEYTFDQRDQLYNHYVKAIKHGGMEIGAKRLLKLHDIIRISVTLTELKEQVGCEARIISVFPPNLRASSEENSSKYRYIVQFIGPNAPETDRILSKYLLGYKVK
ncbi:hypothetical protein LO80_04555 [Candidatus Francisella endociliophora]|uniref:PilZ domain-containing protein n=1 Tax=Candidatus Francisella endociliophora TaxID=653937 RepID=A0A097EP20_9GAMM|nr:hypothetical protein [Francisella sp. FSC1006]AIT09310.1 hypothetical protein LO80_04555 [Francisella sp. FSC1006]